MRLRLSCIREAPQSLTCLCLCSPNGGKLFKYRPFIPFLTRNFPPWLLRSVGKLLPIDALQQQFNLVDTLTLAAEQIWEEKKRLHTLGEKASNSEIGQGRDILSILRTS